MNVQAELAGKYTIHGSLGTGAGGETFEATDLRDGARVALKRLALATTRDWKAVDLFQREARVLAALAHPSIPRLKDSFVIEATEGPISYLAHDFAPGRSLRGWVESGWRPDDAEVARVGCFLLDVLAYLHALHPPVIHRDIKPANVIRSDDGRLWLVDFGAVRDATTTMSGGSTVVGTYGYMAPEQFRGHATAGSDLYGVAATLLYLLSGRPPTDFPQEKLKVAFGAHVRCSRHLAAWMDRALEPAPEDRFPSAAAALAALRDPRAPVRAERRGSRGRVIALVGLLGVAVLGTAGFIANDRRPKKSPPSTWTPANAGPPAVLPRRPQSTFVLVRKGRWFERSHTTPIFAMARSSDGTKVVTGAEGSAKIWDFEHGTVERVLAGHEKEVRGIAFSSDDRKLATSDGQAIRIWDPKVAAPLATIAAAGVSGLAITPDDKHLVATAFDGTIRVYDLATRELVRSFAHGKPIQSLALTPDGARLATGGVDGSLKLWNLGDGKMLAEWAAHGGMVLSIAFSPDGRSIATGGQDGKAELSHLQGGVQRGKTFSWNHDDWAFGVAFSPDGKYVFSTGREGSIQVAHAIEGFVVATRHDIPVSKAFPIFSKDGRSLLVAAGPHMLRHPLASTGLGTKLPDPVADPERAKPDPDREMYREITRLLREVPKVPLSRAEAKVTEAIAQNPQSQLAWLGAARLEMSRAYLRGDEFDPKGMVLARKHLEHAATVGPKGLDWWTTAMWVARAEKQQEAAREAARELQKIAPDGPDAVIAQAELDLGDDQYEKAIASLTKLIATKPLGGQLAYAYVQLRRAYVELGDVDAAHALWRRALASDPQNAWVHGDYSRFLLEEVGDVKRAIEEARAALALMDYGVGRSNLAAALTERADATLWNFGGYDDAIRDYDEAIRLHPLRDSYYGRSAAYRKKAVVKHDARALASARADLTHILERHPKWKPAQRALAELDGLAAVVAAPPE